MLIFFFSNRHISSNNQSDSFDSSSLGSTSVRSLSPFPNWRINYKPMPKKIESKGIWDGYQSQDEFLAMHLR